MMPRVSVRQTPRRRLLCAAEARVMSLVFTGLGHDCGARDVLADGVHGALCIAVGQAHLPLTWPMTATSSADVGTAGRPIPMGRIAREDVLGFGYALSVASVAMMWLFVNVPAAVLLAFTIFFYVGVYTSG